MVEAFVTGPYAFFIAGSYLATFVVMAALIGWVVVTARQRRTAFERLEKAGISRDKS